MVFVLDTVFSKRDKIIRTGGDYSHRLLFEMDTFVKTKESDEGLVYSGPRVPNKIRGLSETDINGSRH